MCTCKVAGFEPEAKTEVGINIAFALLLRQTMLASEINDRYKYGIYPHLILRQSWRKSVALRQKIG